MVMRRKNIDSILPDDCNFYYPVWPVAFFDGSKIEPFTSILGDRLHSISLEDMHELKVKGKGEFLESSYDKARLLVKLFSAQDLGHHQPSRRTPSPSVPSVSSGRSGVIAHRKKHISSPGLEKAIIGRQISYASTKQLWPVVKLTVGRQTFRTEVSCGYSEHVQYKEYNQ